MVPAEGEAAMRFVARAAVSAAAADTVAGRGHGEAAANRPAEPRADHRLFRVRQDLLARQPCPSDACQDRALAERHVGRATRANSLDETEGGRAIDHLWPGESLGDRQRAATPP
jgi:hypothetical protein